MIRRTRVEIDLQAIVGNARAVRQVTGTDLYAVVKADAYGHGAVAVAAALATRKAAAGFCVSLVEEGVALREAGITLPILVMGPSQVGGEEEMVAARLTPVISSHEELAALAHGGPLDAHLKVDTGMGRLGVALEDAVGLARDAQQQGIRIVGLMTHFANADTDDAGDDTSLTRTQIARFSEVDRALVAAGAPLRVRHAANSSAALAFPAARLDLVRCGIALYGNGRWGDQVEQAMRLVTAIAQLRRIPTGASVGYGATWRAARDSRVAVLPCGYADGLPRRASGHAQVAIRGKRVPLVGTVSMDQVVVDVGDDGVQPGEIATLFGPGDAGEPTVRDWAAWAGTVEHEIVTRIGPRVTRETVAGAVGAVVPLRAVGTAA